jgi:hypothetical protein
VPSFGAAESRRLLELVLARPELDDVPVGAMSLALADIRATLLSVYGEIVPALFASLADLAEDPERVRALLEDLRYAFRRVDVHLHRVGWQEHSLAEARSLIDFPAGSPAGPTAGWSRNDGPSNAGETAAGSLPAAVRPNPPEPGLRQDGGES